MTNFEWPWQYSFPPFFTLQPTAATKEKQLEAWTQLVLNYCRTNKILVLDTIEMQHTALFTNKTIDRKLSIDAIRALMDHMVKSNLAKWQDSHRCFILWRSLDEWADLVYNWATNTGNLNTVCTLYELVQGDDTTGEQFYGIGTEVLKIFLEKLEQTARAELINVDGTEGVKFF